MFIIIVFYMVLTHSSPVSLQDFYCFLPRDQSRDVTSRLGVSINYKCTSFRVLASSFRLLLVRLCTNRCAEALAAYRNSLLNRWNIVHGVKILTIIILLLFCHKRVTSNEAAVRKHVICQTCMQQCSHIGSVCHASVVWGCVPLSASSSLNYHFWFLKHHHSAGTHHHHRRCWRSCRTHTACMPSKWLLFSIYFNFLLYVFGIVLNCIIQNNNYCLHPQYFSI